jgi:hypothetical protein
MFIHVLLHTLEDTLRLLPFLFLMYLLMEYLEYNAMGKLTRAVSKVGKAAPLLGGVAGIIPQCGFSAAAAGLFSGGVISAGTMLAVFFSTSDEMLPLFISHGYEFGAMAKILIVKVILAVVSGYAVDAALKLFKIKNKKTIHEFCESEHCECENGILKPAIVHTVKIWIFVFIVTFIMDILFESAGFEEFAVNAASSALISVPIVCLIGLIPNCAASVVITECYLNGIISGGAMMAGLLTSCGVGLLVLFRTNKRPKENIKIVIASYAIGVFWGFVIEALGISF